MSKSFTLGLLIGAAAGAVTGLLLAPTPGAEIRVRITETSREAADKISKAATKVAGIAGEVEDRLRQAI